MSLSHISHGEGRRRDGPEGVSVRACARVSVSVSKRTEEVR